MKPVSESTLQNQILLAASKAGATLFRNNVGQGWIGQSKRIATYGTIPVQPGDVIIRNARPFHAGLCRGSGDICGWVPTLIQESMVGSTHAVFSNLEIKSRVGRASPEQLNFIQQVIKAGGKAGICRSVDDALLIINGETKVQP